MLAIDCEMCETQDPVTGVKDPKTLLRLSIIDGFDPSIVLLDTLVIPGWPVTDWRTTIHGISEQDLAATTFTLRHAQAFLLNLCHEDTIILGHAVHHDLKVQYGTVCSEVYTLWGDGGCG